MSRYIDADKFYASQAARCYGEPIIGTCTSDNALLYDELQKLPTADVVEVIRCKDCEIATKDIMCDGWYFCHNNKLAHNPNHFCSYGRKKRKE